MSYFAFTEPQQGLGNILQPNSPLDAGDVGLMLIMFGPFVGGLVGAYYYGLPGLIGGAVIPPLAGVALMELEVKSRMQ